MIPGWVLLLPLKPLDRAKSRLTGPDPGHRAGVARAMTETVTATARRVGRIREIAVVTAATWDQQAVPVEVLPDPGGGLNPALASAARVAAARWPDLGIAVLLPDAAAVTAEELSVALVAAERHRRAIVADHLGTGTVLLTAHQGAPLAPRFGPGSRREHLRSGAVDLTDRLEVPLMRRDLDTPADLAAVADRLRALPRLHDALRAAGWTGAGFDPTVRSVPA